ncbi:MAG: PepSY domain-containing protein [Emergencia sp.]
MNKILNKKTGIIAAIAVVIIIAAVVVSTSFSQAMTLDEAKEIASRYVPETAKFVTSEEEENKFEVMFHDDSAGEGFEVEVHKDTKKVKKVESQLDNDLGGETVKLTEDEVKDIIKKRFEGVTSVSVTLNKDNGLYEYEAAFKANDFYGDADVHPESGVILESTVKYGTAVTIPTDTTEASGDSILTYEEAEDAAIKAAGGGFVKDIDLEKTKDSYYYEIELIKDNMEYDYIVDAYTGKVTLENEHDSYFDYDDDDYVPSQSSSSSGSSGSTGSSSSAGTSSGSSSSDLISAEKAKSIVLAKIPGANIYKLKLEKDDGIYIYEGEATLGDYEYEFDIDASSGVIIDWDKEHIEHDDDDEWDD